MAVSVPALITVAKAVAGQSTWTERLLGSTAATSGTGPAATVLPASPAVLGNTPVGPQPVVTAKYSGPLNPVAGPARILIGAALPLAVLA